MYRHKNIIVFFVVYLIIFSCLRWKQGSTFSEGEPTGWDFPSYFLMIGCLCRGEEGEPLLGVIVPT
jgi:hypothetical protein